MMGNFACRPRSRNFKIKSWNEESFSTRTSVLPRFFFIGILLFFNFIFLSQKAVGDSSSVRLYDQTVQKMAQKYDVDPDLIHSIIRAESNYDYQAVSSKGAVGLMQLMPETAKEYGVTDRYDPFENIEGGVKFLKDLLLAYDQKDDLVLAAYNAGPEAVKKHNGVPPFPETVQYIKRVKSYWNAEQSSNKNIKTKIFSYRDSTGKIVITNDRNYYLRTKK